MLAPCSNTPYHALLMCNGLQSKQAETAITVIGDRGQREGRGLLFEASCLRVPLADRVLALVAAIGSNTFPC